MTPEAKRKYMHFSSAGFCDKNTKGKIRKKKKSRKKKKQETSVINGDMQVSHGATH